MKCERCEKEIPDELYSITERGLMLSATGHWAPCSFCKSCKKELDSWFFEYGKHRRDECAEIRLLKNEEQEQNVGMCQQNVGEMSEKQTDGDLISRQAVLDLCGTGKWLEEYRAEENGVKTRGYDTLKMINYTKLLKLPAIPQTDYENYEEFGWCKGCKEYDTEKHCCHRYSSFIRESLQDNINAVLEDIEAEMEKEQAECPYPLDIEHAITIIDEYISRKE